MVGITPASDAVRGRRYNRIAISRADIPVKKGVGAMMGADGGSEWMREWFGRAREAAVGLAWLLAFWGLGSGIHRLGVPLPGNVLGMMALAAALFTGVVEVRRVAASAQWLLRYLVLWFVPVIVAVMAVYPQVLHAVVPIFAGIVVGSIAVIVVTGWVVERLAPAPPLGEGLHES